MYKVYILHSRTADRYYTGSTDDLDNRLSEHNSGETKSIRYGIPWTVIHVEEYPTRAEAMSREKLIKKSGSEEVLLPSRMNGVQRVAGTPLLSLE